MMEVGGSNRRQVIMIIQNKISISTIIAVSLVYIGKDRNTSIHYLLAPPSYVQRNNILVMFLWFLW
jgi:hypothetical protein